MKGYYRNGGWQRFASGEEYCFLFALSGKGMIGETELLAGEGVLLDLSQWNAEEISLPTEYLKLDFSERDLLRLFGERGIRANGEVVLLRDTDELRRVAEGFFARETEVTDSARRGALCTWLLSYIENDREMSGEDSAAAGYVRYAEEYIQTHLGESIQVDAIAEELGITRGYLRNVFYAVHGMSPREYLTEARLQRARELLEERDRSVTSIADEVGYDDVLQFSRIFKKHTGASPSQYRADRGIAVEKNRIRREERVEKVEPAREVREEAPKKKAKDPVWLF
ncbi:MAG: helix-turn-helix transcriptional regulator [Clostridia bacterium]|nr:helix-turn-helix transcriptional regulator [Clostridia bacterium]